MANAIIIANVEVTSVVILDSAPIVNLSGNTFISNKSLEFLSSSDLLTIELPGRISANASGSGSTTVTSQERWF